MKIAEKEGRAKDAEEGETLHSKIQKKPDISCARCGRKRHTVEYCFVTHHVDGHVLGNVIPALGVLSTELSQVFDLNAKYGLDEAHVDMLLESLVELTDSGDQVEIAESLPSEQVD